MDILPIFIAFVAIVTIGGGIAIWKVRRKTQPLPTVKGKTEVSVQVPNSTVKNGTLHKPYSADLRDNRKFKEEIEIGLLLYRGVFALDRLQNRIQMVLADIAIQSKLGHSNMSGPLYSHPQEAAPVKTKLVHLESLTLDYPTDTEYRSSNFAFGRLGIYHQETDKAETRTVSVKVTEDVALYVAGLLRETNDYKTVEVGYDDTAGLCYYLTVTVSLPVLSGEQVTVAWPLSNMPDAVYVVFEDRLKRKSEQRRQLTVCNTDGYTHVEWKDNNETIIYSDKTAFYNMDLTGIDDKDCLGKRLLKEHEGKFEPHFWHEIVPNEARTIYWYFNPDLN